MILVEQNGYRIRISRRFVAILEKEIAKAQILPGVAVTISFKDSTYDCESGGFRPLEVG